MLTPMKRTFAEASAADLLSAAAAPSFTYELFYYFINSVFRTFYVRSTRMRRCAICDVCAPDSIFVYLSVHRNSQNVNIAARARSRKVINIQSRVRSYIRRRRMFIYFPCGRTPDTSTHGTKNKREKKTHTIICTFIVGAVNVEYVGEG